MFQQAKYPLERHELHSEKEEIREQAQSQIKNVRMNSNVILREFIFIIQIEIWQNQSFSLSLEGFRDISLKSEQFFLLFQTYRFGFNLVANSEI